MIDWMRNGLIAHNLERPQGLITCACVVDIGAGIRPMQWYKPQQHVCVEPYGPYADRLRAAGYEVNQATATEALEGADPAAFSHAAIYLLDVIEHMDKSLGQKVVQMMLAARPRQIVVFTPLGFLPQQGADAWGLGGDYWQEHRSGWMPEDFPGWEIEISRCGPRAELGRGFFATWTRPIQH